MHRIFPPLKEMIDKDVDAIIRDCWNGRDTSWSNFLVSRYSRYRCTSIYWVRFRSHGQGALTTMLQSCSPGLAIVNIDNGFGAAALAITYREKNLRKKAI